MNDSEYDALAEAIQIAHQIQERAFQFDFEQDDYDNRGTNSKILALTDSLILMLSDIKEEREREEDFARCYRGEEESAEEEDHGAY